MKSGPAAQDRTQAAQTTCQRQVVCAPWETPSSKPGRPRSSSVPWSVLLLAALVFSARRLRADDLSLTLQRDSTGGYEVHSVFWSPGPFNVVWAVLTDYEHLVYVVPSLRTSRVVQRDGNTLLLKQEGVGRVAGLFHYPVEVLLNVRAEPQHQINFEDTSHKSFEFYKGNWTLSPAEGGGVWVEYYLKAKPNAFAPGFIAKGAFRHTATELLEAVEKEIEHRRPPCIVVMAPCAAP